MERKFLLLFSKRSAFLLSRAQAVLLRKKEPKNFHFIQGGDSSRRRDKLLRELDCAVIRYRHDSIERQVAVSGEAVIPEPYDTVRGLFREGEPIYPESGFYERTQTQIAVRSLSCIKGLFQPPR